MLHSVSFHSAIYLPAMTFHRLYQRKILYFSQTFYYHMSGKDVLASNVGSSRRRNFRGKNAIRWPSIQPTNWETIIRLKILLAHFRFCAVLGLDPKLRLSQSISHYSNPRRILTNHTPFSRNLCVLKN